MLELFSHIPKAILDRMQALEERDTKERAGGVDRVKRLRQIPPIAGAQLTLLALGAPEGAMLEIGASGGYSALWLSLAMAQRGDKLVTFELLPEKAEMARETFAKAQVEEHVELVHGDARGHLAAYDQIAFCFLDAEKEMYPEFYEMVAPKLVPGGLLVADNATSHAEELTDFLQTAREDTSVDMAVLPVGKGLLVAVKRF